MEIKRFCVFALSALFAAASVAAQGGSSADDSSFASPYEEASSETNETVFDEYDRAIGGFYGPFAGSGLSYQQWLGRLGYQVSVGGYYTPEGWSTVRAEYWLGSGAQYSLVKADLANWLSAALYLSGGLGHQGRWEGTTGDDGVPIAPFRYIPSLSAGFGVGFEIVLFRRFSFPVELVYAGLLDLNPFGLVTVEPLPQVGFRFRY